MMNPDHYEKRAGLKPLQKRDGFFVRNLHNIWPAVLALLAIAWGIYDYSLTGTIPWGAVGILVMVAVIRFLVIGKKAVE